MGKKGNWCYAVKKALTSESRNKKDKNSRKSKGWFWKKKSQEHNSSRGKRAVVNPAPPSPMQEVTFMDAENEQDKHAHSVALATVAAAEAAVAAAQAAAEVARLTAVARFPSKSKEEIAAIKIQAAFRGHMARRALRTVKALARLKTLVQGQSVKRQATTTLRCMQTMARLQAQIRSRRIRMSEENHALQRHLQQKHEKELEKLRASQIDEDWNDSTQSKEQMEAKRRTKQEAAIRRERALAYAHSHQQTWRKSPKSVRQTIMDPHNPHWGWSWLERWMSARPWESQSAMEKELNGEPNSAKSTSSNAHTRRDMNLGNKHSTLAKKKTGTQTPGRLSVASSPRIKTPTSASAGRATLPSPRRSVWSVDDDARSTHSVQSERYRRHSVTGSSIRDDESLASSPAVPSYMASTKSTKAKSRMSNSSAVEKSAKPEKESAGTTKKRLSYSGSSSGPRRHSGLPKVETASVACAGLNSQRSN